MCFEHGSAFKGHAVETSIPVQPLQEEIFLDRGYAALKGLV